MDTKTKKAVRIIIDHYKLWLSYDNARLRWIVRMSFGEVAECPLCNIYNLNKIRCHSDCCPAINYIGQCYDQEWFREIYDMRGYNTRFSFITVRKSLKERIEYYEDKLRKEG